MQTTVKLGKLLKKAMINFSRSEILSRRLQRMHGRSQKNIILSLSEKEKEDDRITDQPDNKYIIALWKSSLTCFRTKRT